MERQITFGSLFAGIGGFDLGFERAGMCCKWQVEIDDYATKVLEKHWPDVPKWRDVRTFPPGDTDDWRVDCICGGFPCQDISYAGPGDGLAGKRSGLFFDAMRVVRELEPRVVVLENVAALLTRGIHDVLGTLAAIGFDAEWHCLPAAAIGAPHIRDRVFIIGHRHAHSNSNGRETRPRISRVKEIQGIAHGDNAERLRGEVPDPQSERRGEGRSGRAPSAGSGQQDKTEVADTNGDGRHKMEQPNGRGEASAREFSSSMQCGDLRGGHSSWWATEPDVGRVANGVSFRVDRLRGIGNAIVPQVAEWIGKRVVERLEFSVNSERSETDAQREGTR